MNVTSYAPSGVTSVSLSDGSVIPVVGGKFTADSKFASELERAGYSQYASSGMTPIYDPITGAVTGITGPGGVVTPLPGSSLTSGSWYQSPGIFKLILSGVGTVAVEIRLIPNQFPCLC